MIHSNFILGLHKIPEGQTGRRKRWDCGQMIKTDTFKSSSYKEAIVLEFEKSDSGVENSVEDDEIEEDIQCELKDDTNEAEEIIEEEIEYVTEDGEGKFCCEPQTKCCRVLGEEDATIKDNDGVSD